MTTLFKVGGRYINLAVVYKIDPLYVASTRDRRASSEPGVEIKLADGSYQEIFGDEAVALRAFLAGEPAHVGHYTLGQGCEIYDFTTSFSAPESEEAAA